MGLDSPSFERYPGGMLRIVLPYGGCCEQAVSRYPGGMLRIVLPYGGCCEQAVSRSITGGKYQGSTSQKLYIHGEAYLP